MFAEDCIYDAVTLGPLGFCCWTNQSQNNIFVTDAALMSKLIWHMKPNQLGLCYMSILRKEKHTGQIFLLLVEPGRKSSRLPVGMRGATQDTAL